MTTRPATNAVVLAAALAASACGGTRTSAPGSALPNVVVDNGDFQIAATFPKNTIGEELPGEGVGTTKDPKWGKVGGFTQSGHAQVLAFPPGTTITIRNLSKNTQHTLNFVAIASKPPAHFPANPNLSFTPHGGKIFGKGYASGAINPGKSVTVKLAKAGTYLIGCAFHYSEGMQDVLIVKAGATPGPTH